MVERGGGGGARARVDALFSIKIYIVFFFNQKPSIYNTRPNLDLFCSLPDIARTFLLLC